MVNTYRKGYRLEKKVMEIFELVGYTCWRAKITRFGKNDFFGCFDIIAIAKEHPTAWIQVKSGVITKKELNRIKTFCDAHFDPSVNQGFVYVYKNRQWHVTRLFGGIF